jgi:hypothetical protein
MQEHGERFAHLANLLEAEPLIEAPGVVGDPVIGDAFGGIGSTKVGRSSNPILPIVVLVAMLAFLGFIALSHGSSESSLGHDLQSHGIRTVGTVTAAEPSNHDYFSYSYMVNGSQYSGDTNSFTSAQTVDASQLQVGQHIAVTCDAKDFTKTDLGRSRHKHLSRRGTGQPESNSTLLL